jgi:two-component system sensor histidine kinase KdpD
VVVGVARIGGLLPALLAAVSSSLLLNYYFIPPIYALAIADPNNVIALVVFVLVALTVASVVDVEVRLTRRAARASAEAETLSVLAGSVLRGQEAIPALLERSRETFAVASATLLGTVDAASEHTPPHALRHPTTRSGGSPSALPEHHPCAVRLRPTSR